MKEANCKDITNSRENKKLCKEGKVILIIVLDRSAVDIFITILV